MILVLLLLTLLSLIIPQINLFFLSWSSIQFFVKKSERLSILQNGEQKAYVFQNSPLHSATWRKQCLRRKATGMRAPNKISDMKSNDSNLELQ